MSYVSFSNFDSNLGIEYSKFASKELKKDYWVVKKGFRYHLDIDRYIDVPQGFLTDGASVPRLLWGFIPPWGSYGQACVLHDYLCEYLKITNTSGILEFTTRHRSNNIFYGSMVELGVPKYIRLPIYSGVEFYRMFIDDNKPTHTDKKINVEKYLLNEYNKTGNWL